MAKSKDDHIKDLVFVAFRMDEKAELQKQKTQQLQRMATLARGGKKESEEFKSLEREFKHLNVIDFGNEMAELRAIVKRLKKYKW